MQLRNIVLPPIFVLPVGDGVYPAFYVCRRHQGYADVAGHHRWSFYGRVLETYRLTEGLCSAMARSNN